MIFPGAALIFSIILKNIIFNLEKIPSAFSALTETSTTSSERSTISLTRVFVCPWISPIPFFFEKNPMIFPKTVVNTPPSFCNALKNNSKAAVTLSVVSSLRTNISDNEDKPSVNLERRPDTPDPLNTLLNAVPKDLRIFPINLNTLPTVCLRFERIFKKLTENCSIGERFADPVSSESAFLPVKISAANDAMEPPALITFVIRFDIVSETFLVTSRIEFIASSEGLNAPVNLTNDSVKDLNVSDILML